MRTQAHQLNDLADIADELERAKVAVLKAMEQLRPVARAYTLTEARLHASLALKTLEGLMR